MLIFIVSAAFVAAGLYALLRVLFANTGESRLLAGFLAALGLSFGFHSATIGVLLVVLALVFQRPLVGLLTNIGLTRANVERIAKGLIRR